MVGLDHLVEGLEWQMNVFGLYSKGSGNHCKFLSKVLMLSFRQIIDFTNGLKQGKNGSKQRCLFLRNR